jgi:hypothetical protein
LSPWSHPLLIIIVEGIQGAFTLFQSLWQKMQIDNSGL